MAQITLIFSPYHNGNYNIAVGSGPIYLREHGLVTAIEDLGFSAQCVEIQPLDDALDGDIARAFEILRRISHAVATACTNNSFPVIVSGNCNAAVGVASGLQLAYGSSLATSDTDGTQHSKLGCTWFDAHDDFNTPDSLVSGYFDSMPVAMLAGQCFRNLCASIPGFSRLSLERFCYVGIRDVTEEERQRVESHNIASVWGSESSHVDFSGGLGQILDKRVDQMTMVHLDLDCLDVSVGAVNKFSAPGGLLVEDLTRCMETIGSKTQPVSLTIASFDPSFGGGKAISDAAQAALMALLKTVAQQRNWN